jgi:peptidoglycan/LPS O-acetylase OafA/YrhL
VATIVGSCVYAYLILPLDRVQDYFIQQAQAALFSYANFFFIFHKMDYFLQNGNSIFFLHTWSLGIEEQFYLLIPILIWIVIRFVRNSDHFNHFRVWNRVFATLAVISFLTSLVLKFNIVEVGTTEFRQLFVFYSPVTRAWEFLIGILLALQWNRNRERIQKQTTGCWKFAFLAGLFVLQTGILLSSHRGLLSQFGSSSATAVVTAILIFALPRLAIQQNRFVNHPVIQLVGNASYSIYLWHWIAVSIGEDMFHPPSAYQTLFLLTLSFVPALLSYQFVEKPFRRVRDLRGSTKLAIGLGLVCIPFLILSALLVTARSERRDYGNVYASSVLDGCDFLNEICKVGSPQAKKKVLVFGDSHAYQLIPILKSYAESNDVELTTCAKFCASENFHSRFRVFPPARQTG